MDISSILDIVNKSLNGPLGCIVGALLIFVLGYIVAKIIAHVVRKVLTKLSVNSRLSSFVGDSVDLEKIISKVIFWFIFIIAISGALSKLNISAISEPLAKMVSQVLSFLPVLMGAAVIFIIGLVVATIVRTLIGKALSKTSLDSQLGEESASDKPLSSMIADIFYWIILLIALTMVLGELKIDGLFGPLTNMLDKAISFLPNIFLAGVVFFVGYIVAKIIRNIVTNLVAATNLQALTSKAGLSSKSETSLPNLAGSLVFLLIIIPVSITALNALKIDVIARPASNMLNKVFSAIPSVFMAVALLVITYFIMRLVTNIIKGILENTSVNALPEKLGLQDVLGNSKVSDVIAHLILVVAMLFATIAASSILGFTQIGDIITMFIGFGGNILLGAVILVIGFWLAGLVAGVINRSEQGSPFVANIVRVLIMGLVLAMGLKAMGIADSIVNLAFGLTLGSVAVAFALSFGLGGQEAAARCLRKLQDKLDTEDKNKDAE